MAEFAGSLKVGKSTDPSIQIGPISSNRQLTTVLSCCDGARDEGAEIVVGGARKGGHADYKKV